MQTTPRNTHAVQDPSTINDNLQAEEDSAHIASNQGKYSEAESLLRKVLAERSTTLSSTHPHVLRAKNNLAACLNNQYKNLVYAESLQLEVVAADKESLGAEHPETLMDLNNLAQIYMHQGRYEKAIGIQREALEISQRTRGEADERTLTLRENLANSLVKQGEAFG